ncbi:UDP-N-acetylmuramoyl-L-alanyl-D-glutamate--2,6-diaminopimelate ligase [Paenibacillus sp. MBLB4367]|uniref:UDP-N-acetylmuramoyl-L-alanyl-D-glutamate--2, 6-diaminopimelate ligase n=1 Tax=Paenibacillus sp. MBLB4367 TaxID=3384767 RepID=UPI003908180A
MRLNEVAALLPVKKLIGDGTVEFTGLKIDSHLVQSGDLYLCVPTPPNLKFKDRHQFAGDAIANGAVALLCERELDVNVPMLIVPNVRFAMAVIANHLYGYPSRELQVIGVTGTNGKTTTAHIMEHIMREQGFQTGLMGNLGLKIGDERIEYEGNTLESPDLQQSFRRMSDANVDYCFMEVSSHGLQLGRVLGTRFRTAVFTNLTQDHLDFHLTMDAYREAKGLFFSRLGNEFYANPEDRKYAILNADDEASAYFANVTPAQVITYGIANEADVRATDIRITAQGTSFRLHSFAGGTDISLKLIGKFNVYNALGAIAAALVEGVPVERIRASLATMPVVDGRMETVDEGQPFLVAVDYAHTPDGVENALATIKEFAEGRILTVFGCGGDRDRTKRPIMGNIAARYSDYVFVTSDNPRTEDPQAILLDIEPGLQEAHFPADRYELLEDRREAIKKAIEMASPGDVVLIAGKGHETYQLIGGVTHHFDDREEAREAIRGLNK